MITIEDVLSHRNIEAALAHFAAKRNGAGPDGMRVNELPEYWKANGERIRCELREGCYQFGVVRFYETVSSSGKKRNIASINVIDRFVERLFQQRLKEELEPTFSKRSFAFQEGKGTLPAAMFARELVEAGNRFICEIDIKNYFEEIPHDGLMDAITRITGNDVAGDVLRSMMGRFVEQGGRISRSTKGLLQGAPASPALSNLYLHDFDRFMEQTELDWFRFADNIYVYTKTQTEALAAFNSLTDVLWKRFSLKANTKKSGVFKALERRVLGFNFYKTDEGRIDIRRHCYQKRTNYRNWHPSVAYEGSREVHIVQNGILNRKDYSLIFENEDEKHHIPVEVTDYLNIYGEVCVSPQALATLNEKGIRLSYFDKYGNLAGVYTPQSHGRSAQLFLKQCEFYANDSSRLELSKEMEMAGLGNMRMNLQYYRTKKGSETLAAGVAKMDALIDELAGCETQIALLMVEARARQLYYSFFDEILAGTGFAFEKRTRRPPQNELNAMISFGNTLLYNKFLQIIWKTPLDPKIGVVHATNRRDHSLNLDFADIFKPVVVDKVIFSLVNRREIKPDMHFRRFDDGAVLLNEEGKRMLIRAFEKKLHATTKRRGSQTSYAKLLADEVDGFRALLENGEKYRPYKIY